MTFRSRVLSHGKVIQYIIYEYHGNGLGPKVRGFFLFSGIDSQIPNSESWAVSDRITCCVCQRFLLLLPRPQDFYFHSRHEVRAGCLGWVSPGQVVCFGPELLLPLPVGSSPGANLRSSFYNKLGLHKGKNTSKTIHKGFIMARLFVSKLYSPITLRL